MSTKQRKKTKAALPVSAKPKGKASAVNIPPTEETLKKLAAAQQMDKPEYKIIRVRYCKECGKDECPIGPHGYRQKKVKCA